MAQQQPGRDEFGNAVGAQEERDRRDCDARKNEQQQESDRWKEEFGRRAGNPEDPAAPYAFATGYGAPAPAGVASGPYGGVNTDYGAAGGNTGIYQSTTDPTAGYGTTATGGVVAGQGRGGDATAGGGGGGGAGDAGRNRNLSRDDMNLNRERRDLK